MFRKVFGSGKALQIIYMVIQFIPIFMVNHAAGRQLAVRLLPYVNGSELPNIRIGNFNPRPLAAASVRAFRHRMYRQIPRPAMAFLELARRMIVVMQARRKYIGIELQQKYIDITRRRLSTVQVKLFT